MQAKPRIVVIGNSQSFASAILLNGLLKALKKNQDAIKLEGVFDGAVHPAPSIVQKAIRKIGLPIVRRLFDPQQKIVLKWPLLGTIYHIAGRYHLNVRHLPHRNINHPDCVNWLTAMNGPVVLVSLGMLQVYGRPVLDAVWNVVNYHNGALPGYKGLHATSWELYRDEPFAGYTFHYMNSRIDGGNILMQGRLAAGKTRDPLRLEYEKACRAAKDMPMLLNKIRWFDAGEPQYGDGAYYSEMDFHQVRTIDDPSKCTYADLQNRLRCFGMIYLRIDNRRYHVTKIQKAHQQAGHDCWNCFLTRDHVPAKATRFSFLPYRLKRILESF